METEKSWEGTTRRYYPPLGRILLSRPVAAPPFTTKSTRLKPSFARGLRYEKKVCKALSKEYAAFWRSGCWFQYQAERDKRSRYCQVDGLLDAACLVVCEVKLRHTPEAYFQLFNLYLPVVQAAYPGRDLALCEVTKWYDSSTEFPCAITLLADLHAARPGDFSVHIRGER